MELLVLTLCFLLLHQLVAVMVLAQLEQAYQMDLVLEATAVQVAVQDKAMRLLSLEVQVLPIRAMQVEQTLAQPTHQLVAVAVRVQQENQVHQLAMEAQELLHLYQVLL
jgi:hypothetical protein